jgi:hypothetical protein
MRREYPPAVPVPAEDCEDVVTLRWGTHGTLDALILRPGEWSR